MTNDPKHSKLILKVTGNVEKIVDVLPKRVKLEGIQGNPIKSSVTIIPEKKYSFNIIGSQATNGQHITYEVKKLKDRLGYVVEVKNSKKSVGRYYDTIVLHTDNKAVADIKITVYGNILAKKSKQIKKSKVN